MWVYVGPLGLFRIREIVEGSSTATWGEGAGVRTFSYTKVVARCNKICRYMPGI